VIDVAVGQRDGTDARVARSARLQRRKALDVPEYIGRCVDQ
jgi:hypothetical protein